ncbi:MAG: hypothetical protein ACUVQT_03515 [bacterium]
MNRLLLSIIFVLSSLWAVKPVTRIEKPAEDKKPVIQIQNLQKNKEDNQNHNNDTLILNESKDQSNKNDQFIDVDSNNVNDQRENDLLKIKQLKTKIKDLFKKEEDRKRAPKSPEKTKKNINK